MRPLPLRLRLPPRLLLPMHLFRRPRPHHPILHRQPLTPRLLRGLNLLPGRVLQRPHKRHRLPRSHIIIFFHARPTAALGGEKVVAPFLLVEGADAGGPVIAEETVEHAGEVKASDDEAPEVGDEGDGVVGEVGGGGACGVSCTGAGTAG